MLRHGTSLPLSSTSRKWGRSLSFSAGVEKVTAQLRKNRRSVSLWAVVLNTSVLGAKASQPHIGAFVECGRRCDA